MKSRNGKYRWLGKLVELYYPEIANSLIAASTPIEQDLSKLPVFLSEYRQHIGHDDLLPGELRVFIGVLLRLYKPHLYVLSGRPPIGQDGFSRALAATLSISEHWTSELIRQAVVWDKKNFEGTAEKVQDFLKSVKQAA